MTKFLGVWAAAVFAVCALGGCEDCNGGGGTDRTLAIVFPTDGMAFSAENDVDDTAAGINIDVYVLAEAFSVGQTITLAIDESEMEATFNGNPVIFVGANLGTGAGPVTLVASSGSVESEPVVVTRMSDECPTVTITTPAAGTEWTESDDEDPASIGFQHEVVVSTNAPAGATAHLFIDGSSSGETTEVEGTVARFDMVDLPEGEHSIEVRIDGAPTACDWPSVAFTIDTEAPECDIVSPAGGVDVLNIAEDDAPDVAGMQSDFRVDTDAGERITVELFVGGDTRTATAETTTGSVTFDAVGMDEGVVQVYATCVDQSGNGSRATRGFTVDTVRPTLEIESPEDGAFITADELPSLDGLQFEVCVSSASTDVSGQEACALRVGASPLDPEGCETLSAGRACVFVSGRDGDMGVEASIEDIHGNPNAPEEAHISVTVDTEYPDIQITAPAAGATLNMSMDSDAVAPGAQYDVVACANKDGTAVLLVDGVVVAGTSGTPAVAAPCALPDGSTSGFTVTFLGATIPDGIDRELSAEFVATTGLTATSPTVVVGLVDTVPPDIDFIRPTCGELISELDMPISPRLRISDPTDLHIDDDAGSSVMTGTGTPGVGGYLSYSSTTLSPGTYCMWAYAEDDAENINETGHADCCITVARVYTLTARSADGLLLGPGQDRDGGAGYAARFLAESTNVPTGTTIHAEVDSTEVTTFSFTRPSSYADLPLTEGVRVVRLWADVDGDDVFTSGTDPESSVTVTVDLTPPGGITSLSVTVLQRRESSLRAAWNAPTGEGLNRYLVRWSHDPITDEASFSAAHDVPWSGVPAAPGGADSIDIRQLAIERDYYVAIRGVDAAGVQGPIVATGSPQRPAFTTQVTRAGVSTWGSLGLYLTLAGDLNGDGVDDLAVGAADTGYIFYGPVPAPPAGPWASNVTISLPGGWATPAGIGDFNGDGDNDLAVGAPYDGTGRVYVFYGGAAASWGATLDATDADVVISPGASGGNLGLTLAGVGEFCGTASGGDGYADFAVSAPEAGNGRVYVVCGGPVASGTVADVADATDAVTTLRIDSAVEAGGATPSFGYWLAGLGDINGDNRDDLAIGHYRRGPGDVYVVRGLAASDIVALGSFLVTDSAHVQTLSGTASGEWFGIGLAGAGDLDGDGFADLAVGAPFNDVSATDSGMAYVYLSNGTWLDTTPSTIRQASSASAYTNLGYAIAANGAGLAGEPDRSIGRLTGGGERADLVVAIPYITPGGAPPNARLGIVYGATGAFGAGTELLTTELSDNLGTPESQDGPGALLTVADDAQSAWYVSYVGDLNHDTFDDFAVSDMEWDAAGDPAAANGRVVVYF